MAKKDNTKKKRKVGIFEDRKNYLIFCEGEKTEPDYFKGFKAEIDTNTVYKDLINIKCISPGKTTKELISYAKKYIKDNKIKGYDVWCVYDKDDFKSDDFDNAQTMCNSLNEKRGNSFNSAWSNQCFEYWYILHFNYYDSNNHRAYYIDFLTKKFKKIGLNKYEKNNPDNYSIMKEYGNPKKAIGFAKRRIAECNNVSPSKCAPATTVYKLVEELSKYLPDEDKEKFI